MLKFAPKEGNLLSGIVRRGLRRYTVHWHTLCFLGGKMIYSFPQPLYVRYIDIFHENGTMYMRRFPISSITDGNRLISALKMLGILTDEERWEIKIWEKNRPKDIDGILWWERDLLWITDSQGEFASYMIFPSDQDAIEEVPEEALTNVIRVDFRKNRQSAVI